MSARTLWHTIYDQHALTAHTSFYGGETAARAERRSPYLHFTLSTARPASRRPALGHAQSLRAPRGSRRSI